MTRTLNLDKMREKYLVLAKKAEERGELEKVEQFMVAANRCLSQKHKVQDAAR